MANKKKQFGHLKRPHKPSRARNVYVAPEEKHGAVAVTVAWMLALMSTLASELFGFACQVYMRFAEDAEIARVLAHVMLLVAFVSGIVTLLLIPVVLAVKKSRPPSLILQIAFVAGALPLCTVFLRFLLR